MESFSLFVVAVTAVREETGGTVDDYSPHQREEESVEHYSSEDYDIHSDEYSSDEVVTNLTLVDDYFREEYVYGLVEDFNNTWFRSNDLEHEMLYEAIPTERAVFWNLKLDVVQYSDTFYYKMMLEFSSSMGNATLQSVRQDINVTCGKSLERR